MTSPHLTLAPETSLDANLPSQRLARRLLTGDVGLKLFRQLVDEFPTINLIEVLFGVTLAWTDLQTGLVAAEAEIYHLRRRLDEAHAA